jgi:CRP/FNR family transcriptional regulator, cyclic AMP receptor protein
LTKLSSQNERWFCRCSLAFASIAFSVSNDRVEQLSKITLFRGLNQEALGLIAQIAVEESHGLGTKIFEHGDTGEKLYLILEGKIRISREVAGMGEEALAILGPGSVFGEMSLVDESPRSADARVHERCRVLAISKDGFEDLLFLHKELAYEVLWNIVRMLSERLRQTNDKLTFLSISGKF